MGYVYQITDEWQKALPDAEVLKLNKFSKHKDYIYNLACGFDIETTTIIRKEKNQDIRHSYMYIWQFAIEDIVIIGRTWKDFYTLIDGLEKKYTKDGKVLIWIHNLSYEASFMLSRLNDRITNQFYKDKHKPLFIEIDDKIRFQDSLAITGCSLEKTAEIYNLQHKKLKNDLDYTKMRNSKTKLTDIELMYCYHDVLILSDFARLMIDNIIPNNFNKLPLTKTQLFLNKVYNYMEYSEKLHIHDILLTFSEYIEANRYLFRGGYVHSNYNHTGEIIENVQSVDFTSSYPAVMLHNKNYPVGKFRKVNLEKLTKKQFENLLSSYACWIDISFYNLKSTTTHSIESKSKVKEISATNLIDNGRVSSADYMRVELTELDFEIYSKFYSWDEMQINSMKIARRGALPEGLLKALKEDYIIKSKLKKEGKKDSIEYILAKQNINSAYGACCKKIPFKNWSYSNGWIISNENESEEQVYSQWESKNNILPFQFACWITSNARYNLLKTVYEIGDDALYCDTDSIKIKNYEKHRDVILKYNEEIKEMNKELLEIDEAFSDLGEFDENDGFYEKFKTLGAKRYLVIEDEKPHVTVAGLPKQALIEHSKKHNVDIMDIFLNNMSIPSEESMKLTTCYNEEPHSDLIIDEEGNAEIMTELSSCALYEIPFNMTLSAEYISMLAKSTNYNNMYLC